MSELRDETREQLVRRIADLTSKLTVARSTIAVAEEMYRIFEAEGILDAQTEAVAAERARVARESEPRTVRDQILAIKAVPLDGLLAEIEKGAATSDHPSVEDGPAFARGARWAASRIALRDNVSDRQHCAACSGWVSTYSGQGEGYACDGMDNPVAEITEKPSRETRSVTVETISASQLRSYGDHVYESYLTFSVPEGQLWASKYGETEAIVRQYIPLFVHSFSEVKPYQWPNAWLETLEQVSPGRWHVIIKSPYLD